jgi:hypothetical protein
LVNHTNNTLIDFKNCTSLSSKFFKFFQ